MTSECPVPTSTGQVTTFLAGALVAAVGQSPVWLLKGRLATLRPLVARLRETDGAP